MRNTQKGAGSEEAIGNRIVVQTCGLRDEYQGQERNGYTQQPAVYDGTKRVEHDGRNTEIEDKKQVSRKQHNPLSTGYRVIGRHQGKGNEADSHLSKVNLVYEGTSTQYIAVGNNNVECFIEETRAKIEPYIGEERDNHETGDRHEADAR